MHGRAGSGWQICTTFRKNKLYHQMKKTERIILDKMAYEVKVELSALLCVAEISLISIYRLHKSPPLVFILSQMKSVLILTYYFFKIYLNINPPKHAYLSPEWSQWKALVNTVINFLN
jgi:hypothetical protein